MGPEFLLAFQAARFALDGIRSCVEMLNTGTAEIQRVKKDVTQAVESGKALYTEVTGIWGWLKGLFGNKPEAAKPLAVPSAKPEAAEPGPATKKAAPADDEYIDHIPNEDEVVEQFLTHFTNFVEAQTTILDAIEDAREQILNVWNPKQNNRRAAIDLIRYERRINDMAMELSGLMASGPKKLGSVRDEFSEKLDIVRNAQAKAKDRARIRRLQELWQRRLLRDHRIDRGITVATVLALILWMWGVLLSLGWLAKTPDGLSLPL